MKRFTLAGIAALLIGLCQTATAQVEAGFRAGANWGAVSKPDFVEQFSPEFRLSPGPAGAVFLEFPVSDRVSIRPEVQFIQKGFLINESLDLNLGSGINLPLGARVAYQTYNLEVPLLFKFKLSDGPVQPYFLAGGAAGYALDGRVRTRASGLFRTQPFDIGIPMGGWAANRWDFSGIAGLGISAQAGAGKLFAEARYQHGFTRQYDLPVVQLPIRNRGVNVSVGYSFPIGR